MRVVQRVLTPFYWLALCWVVLIPVYLIEPILFGWRSHWMLEHCATGYKLRVVYPSLIIFVEYLLAAYVVDLILCKTHRLVKSAHLTDVESKKNFADTIYIIVWCAFSIGVFLIAALTALALAIPGGLDSAQLMESEIASIEIGWNNVVGFFAVLLVWIIRGKKSYFSKVRFTVPMWLGAVAFNGICLLNIQGMVVHLTSDDLPQIQHYGIENTGCGG